MAGIRALWELVSDVIGNGVPDHVWEFQAIPSSDSYPPWSVGSLQRAMDTRREDLDGRPRDIPGRASRLRLLGEAVTSTPQWAAPEPRHAAVVCVECQNGVL